MYRPTQLSSDECPMALMIFKIVVVKSANSVPKMKDDSFTFDTLDSEAQEFIDDSASNVFKSRSTSHEAEDMTTAHESILLDMQFQFQTNKPVVRMRRRNSAPHNALIVRSLPKSLTDTRAHRPPSMIRPLQRQINSSDTCDTSSIMSNSVATCTSRTFTKDRCLERKEVEDMDRRMILRVKGRTNSVPYIRNLLLNEDAKFPAYLNRAKVVEHQLKEKMEQEQKERQSRQMSLKSHSPEIPWRKSLAYTPNHRTLKSSINGYGSHAPLRKDNLDDLPVMTYYVPVLKGEGDWTVELPKEGLDSLSKSHIDHEGSMSIGVPASASCRDRVQRSRSVQNISKRIIERVVVSTSSDTECRRNVKSSGRSSSIRSIRNLTAIVEQTVTEATPIVEGKTPKTKKKLIREQKNEKDPRRKLKNRGMSSSVTSIRDSAYVTEQHSKQVEDTVLSVREKKAKKKLTVEQKEEKERRRSSKK